MALQAEIVVTDGRNNEVKACSRATNHTLETRKYDDNHLRIALYNFGGKTFAETDEPLFEIITGEALSDADGMEMFRILAVDANANEYALGSRSMIDTGVEGVSDDAVRIEKGADGIVI